MINMVKTNLNNADTTMIHERPFLSLQNPDPNAMLIYNANQDDAANVQSHFSDYLLLAPPQPFNHHSLKETAGETTAGADSLRLSNVEEAWLSVDTLLHGAAPLARIRLPVKVNVVVKGSREAGLLQALASGRAHAVSAGESEDLGREDLVQQAAGVDGVEGVASTLVVVGVLGVTEERTDAEGGAGGQVGGALRSADTWGGGGRGGGSGGCGLG